MAEFKKYKLGDIADIRTSNVDKKITLNQKTVKLCNFVDVYYNWAITKSNYDSFMTATASDEEISNKTSEIVKEVRAKTKLSLRRFSEFYPGQKV